MVRFVICDVVFDRAKCVRFASKEVARIAVSLSSASGRRRRRHSALISPRSQRQCSGPFAMAQTSSVVAARAGADSGHFNIACRVPRAITGDLALKAVYFWRGPSSACNQSPWPWLRPERWPCGLRSSVSGLLRLLLRAGRLNSYRYAIWPTASAHYSF
eukprot:6212200-Pleurochrysis_carterae.AAC.2